MEVNMEKLVDTTDPDFIKCAMDALEEGVMANEIEKECCCRMEAKAHEQHEYDLSNYQKE